MRLRQTRGFTLVELLVYTVISSVLISAVFGLLISQSRHFRRQLEVTDVRETLRSAVGVLVFDLQQASPGRGDLVSIAPQSVVLRSIKGSGIVCAVGPTVEQYGVWQPLGRFVHEGGDSLLIYDGATESWVARRVLNIMDGAGPPPLDSCAWSVSLTPEKVVHVQKVGAGVGQVGASVQRFHHVEYKMIQWNSRWWLGRRVGANPDEVLTGPLETPGDSGLVLHYYNGAGVETADPTRVTRVEIQLRAASQGTAVRHDSAFAHVMLRNQ